MSRSNEHLLFRTGGPLVRLSESFNPTARGAGAGNRRRRHSGAEEAGNDPVGAWRPAGGGGGARNARRRAGSFPRDHRQFPGSGPGAPVRGIPGCVNGGRLRRRHRLDVFGDRLDLSAESFSFWAGILFLFSVVIFAIASALISFWKTDRETLRTLRHRLGDAVLAVAHGALASNRALPSSPAMRAGASARTSAATDSAQISFFIGPLLLLPAAEIRKADPPGTRHAVILLRQLGPGKPFWIRPSRSAGRRRSRLVQVAQRRVVEAGLVEELRTRCRPASRPGRCGRARWPARR